MKRSERGQAGVTMLKNNRPGKVAWVLAIAAIISVVIGFGLGIRYLLITGDGGSFLSHVSITPFVTIVYAILGALIITKQPKNPIGWIFLAVSLLYALNNLSIVYHDYMATLGGSEEFTGVDLAAWLNNWTWMPAIFLSTIYVFLLFPDGRLLSPRWRIISWAAGLGLALIVLAVMLHPGPIESWDLAENPYGLPVLASALDMVFQIANVLLVIGFVGGIASFIIRFRRSRGIEREQMKWLIYALILMLVLIIFTGVLTFALPDSQLVLDLSIALTSLSILGIAVAASIAILRYRLYDIDLVINRTLVYGGLTAGIIFLYALVVGGLSILFQVQGSPLIALLATGLVAVLFQPMRERLQRGVNRLFYGERDDPLAALSQLGQQLEAALTPEVVLPSLVETIAQTMKLPYVAISLQTGEEFKIAAQSGHEVAETMQMPLIYQGEMVGQLIAGSRGPGESFSQSDARLLENIAHQSSAAVHAVQLTAALQHSRLQLVTAREEERRRLRRDLHDGLGATLAALNLEAGALRRSIRSDPQKAELLVDELRADIRATIEDIRRLVYDLRPPTLDQLGLVAAVRAQAEQCSRPGEAPAGQSSLDSLPTTAGSSAKLDDPLLQVEVDAPEELPPLPAAVEVAAYRIAQEALTNVVHHSQARYCLVRLKLADDLELEIVDDGIGLASDRNGLSGIGLISMRERAVELGGTCVVEPAPGGGTRVLASLPLQEA